MQVNPQIVAPQISFIPGIDGCNDGNYVHEVFVDEDQMKSDILKMLADFAAYMKSDFLLSGERNSDDEIVGCFQGENTMGSNEAGVRPNADMSMICAFLVKYGKGHIELPGNVTWEGLDSMAIQSLRYAYSTHKANKLIKCSDGKYWGSVSIDDYVWESSLWAMSVAYSAFFQWEKLTPTQKEYIYQLLKAECNYELERSVPTNYVGDTNAEENGWEADVLAATLGLFPYDELAPLWFEKLRVFAINSLSHPSDASNSSIIDPDYDGTTVSQLYCGQNLLSDYTLQNHNYFHTSYQNVVIQELGEAALALKMFQLGLYGLEKWKTNALMHNCDNVMKYVLNWLALADGELAMPNGNDWSLFLYDQITSYSTNACFLEDPDALMLENLAYKRIKARQGTTEDGSWLLRADVGARRMGVEAHRVMMTWLLHEMTPTKHLIPSSWSDFNNRYKTAKVFDTQKIIRASSKARFTCFSWCEGIQSYTGYIAPFNTDNNNIIVPYKQYNTGNYLGWYDVEGCNINATPIEWKYELSGNSYIVNGELNTNDESLNHRFSIFSTPGNAVVYMDNVTANKDATILNEKGGLMGISIDDFTRKERTLYTDTCAIDFDQSVDNIVYPNAKWLNIDNTFGIVTSGEKDIFIGDVLDNNSIYTAQLSTLYSNKPKSVNKNDLVDSRVVSYYCNTNSSVTSQLSSLNTYMMMPEGWKGCIITDPDNTRYLFISNFIGLPNCQLECINTSIGSPVFNQKTSITKNGSSASFHLDNNQSYTEVLSFFIKGDGLTAEPAADDNPTIRLENNLDKDNEFYINCVVDDGFISAKIALSSRQVVLIELEGNQLMVKEDTSDLGKMLTRQDNSTKAQSYDLNGVRISRNVSNQPIIIIGGKKVLNYGH